MNRIFSIFKRKPKKCKHKNIVYNQYGGFHNPILSYRVAYCFDCDQGLYGAPANESLKHWVYVVSVKEPQLNKKIKEYKRIRKLNRVLNEK